MTEWTAYEQVYGSLLIHERIDAGFAQVCMMLAQDGKRHTQREFMPPWFIELTREAELEKGMGMMRRFASADD